MKNEIELIKDVENQLIKGNFKYEKKIVIGDVRPDFLVTTEQGHQIVLEVKAWGNSSENISRALHQSKRYQELSKASAALIVTGISEAISISSGGIVSVSNLLDALSSFAKTLSKKKIQITTPLPTKLVFASMPFAGKYDDTFLVAIEPAALKNAAIADRVNHNGQVGNILSQIQTTIKKADVVIADLSESRPNVLHEIGYAEALGKIVIQICSTSIEKLPFNVRNNTTIKYSIGQAKKLSKNLEIELGNII